MDDQGKWGRYSVFEISITISIFEKSDRLLSIMKKEWL